MDNLTRIIRGLRTPSPCGVLTSVRLPAADILATAAPGKLAGFSSDLLILQLNSASPAHDGARGAFYETLKSGRAYEGFYAGPWREIAAIYQALRAGRLPSPK